MDTTTRRHERRAQQELLSRRRFLRHAGAGLGSIALAARPGWGVSFEATFPLALRGEPAEASPQRA